MFDHLKPVLTIIAIVSTGVLLYPNAETDSGQFSPPTAVESIPPAGQTRANSISIEGSITAVEARYPGEPPAIPTPETATVTPGQTAGIWPPGMQQVLKLESADPDTALIGLEKLALHADPSVRLHAIEALADLDHAARDSALILALDDNSPRIRIAAIDGLAMSDSLDVVPAIESRLWDPVLAVRLAAIDALAATEAPAAESSLGALLGDPHRQVRRQAAAALGEIGSVAARAYLLQLLHDPDPLLRASATDMVSDPIAIRP